MTFKDFYDISKYLNVSQRGKFSERELREFARENYNDYKSGIVEYDSALASTISTLVEEYELYADDDAQIMIGNWLEDMSQHFGYTSYNGFERFLSDFRNY